MPHDLTWEANGVYWKYHGHVSGKEIIDASTVVYGDPRFDLLKYKLVDFLEVNSFNVEKNDVLFIAHQHKSAERFNPNIKNAIVVNSHAEKLAHSFADFFTESRWEVRVFQDLHEANNWLERIPSL